MSETLIKKETKRITGLKVKEIEEMNQRWNHIMIACQSCASKNAYNCMYPNCWRSVLEESQLPLK